MSSKKKISTWHPMPVIGIESDDLNNFPHQFMQEKRALLQNNGKWHMVNLFRLGATPPSGVTYSEKYLSQTGEEFFTTLDKVVENLGLKLPHLQTAIEQSRKAGTGQAKIFEMLRPVYNLMLESGYTHGDLCVGT